MWGRWWPSNEGVCKTEESPEPTLKWPDVVGYWRVLTRHQTESEWGGRLSNQRSETLSSKLDVLTEWNIGWVSTLMTVKQRMGVIWNEKLLVVLKTMVREPIKSRRVTSGREKMLYARQQQAGGNGAGLLVRGGGDSLLALCWRILLWKNSYSLQLADWLIGLARAKVATVHTIAVSFFT